MAYTPFHADWKPKPDPSTPISDVALEHIESGIATAADIADSALALAGRTPLNTLIKPPSASLYPASDVTTYPTLSQTYPSSPAATAQYNFGSGSTPNTPPRWSMFGTNGVTSSAGYAVLPAICGNSAIGSSWILEFYTDSADFTVFLNITQASIYDFKVWCDGMPMTVGWQTGGASQWPVGANFIRTQFATTRVRKMTFAFQGGIQMGALISNHANVGFWPTEQRFRCAVVGDSYIQGGFLDPIDNGPIAAANIPNMLSLLTGWEVFGMGEGGTGYCNPGTNPNDVYNSTSRNNALAALPALDLILVWGGGNDNAIPLATVQAAQTAYYDALKAARPNTPIVVVGPETFPATSMVPTALDAGMRTTALAHSQVRGYISELTPDQWITGTGAQPIANGNAQFLLGSDALHPSRAGTAYLARRTVSALSKIQV